MVKRMLGEGVWINASIEDYDIYNIKFWLSFLIESSIGRNLTYFWCFE